MSTQAYDKFKLLLAELFMFDQADLDFGIYRIMNAKRDEIIRFLDNDLLPQVKKALSTFDVSNRAEVEADLEKATKAATQLGISPDASPKVQELRQQLGETTNVHAAEEEIFSFLYNFFRRYYDTGDFISQRRYKPGVYAVPYEGEELKLHWANADQYYIKSAEHFRDYAFRLPDGRRMHFKIVSGDTELNNNQTRRDRERHFVLTENEPVVVTDGELVARFEYRPLDEKKTHEERIAETSQRILSSRVAESWVGVLSRPSHNPDKTILQQRLAEYSARNKFDYFIHKDLGRFLRRELDFFIKNEILHLDAIGSETAPRLQGYLARIGATRQIGHKIIDFLAQLEDFQKRLWLKKKFVVETNYCITLDRCPDELLPDITANKAQLDDWKVLFAVDEIQADTAGPAYTDPPTTQFLRANSHLVIDTKHFPRDFTARLISSIDNLDAATNGVVVSSDNFQALEFLEGAYRERIQLVYLDPPYNTGEDEFLYKDQYQHSSWASLIFDRCAASSKLVAPSGATFVSIDDTEYKLLWFVLGEALGVANYLGSFVWKRRSASGLSAHPISLDHEYILAFGRNSRDTRLYGLVKGEDLYPFTDAQTNQKFASTDLTIGATREQRPNQFYPLTNPRTGKVYPPNPNRVWRFFPETMAQVIADDLILWPDECPDQNLERPRFKTYYHPEEEKTKPCSSWIETASTNDREIEEEENDYALEILKSGMNQEGGRIVDRMFGSRAFAYPKPLSLIRSLVRMSTRNDDVVLDFFAGSGTTGHAVISMNREDGGDRKYLLIESGEYVDNVLKPRLMKSVYSADWRDGKPFKRNGVSHLLKYIRLESYEDTLNNLRLRPRTLAQQSLLDGYASMREPYVLHYMLNIEADASLLSVDRFEDPFNYVMQIATGTVGETRSVVVDLVETFNYLIGLRVKRVVEIGGFRVVEGRSPQDKTVVVIWRNTNEKANNDLDRFVQEQNYNAREGGIDIIYVNGDNTLLNLRRSEEHWEVRLIEEEFQKRMFNGQDL
jgi:adenine-specific DNA-methyltransferase